MTEFNERGLPPIRNDIDVLVLIIVQCVGIFFSVLVEFLWGSKWKKKT